jgi:cytoskeletal protein RodZ
MTQYPHDEFDDVPERTEREGSHREFLRVKNPRLGLWILVAIGVVVLVFGLIMFTVVRPADIGKDDGPSAGATTSADASSNASADDETGAASTESGETAEPSADPTDEADSTDAAAETTGAAEPSASESDSEEPSESPSESESVNHGIGVGVYNSTSQTGLAAEKATQLRNAGFTSVAESNWTRRGDNSAVYYRNASDEATAREVASTLGISAVAQTSNIGTDVAVVIGN